MCICLNTIKTDMRIDKGKHVSKKTNLVQALNFVCGFMCFGCVENLVIDGSINHANQIHSDPILHMEDMGSTLDGQFSFEDMLINDQHIVDDGVLIEDLEPLPEDMSPLPEDMSPLPEDMSPLPEDMSPPPEEMNSRNCSGCLGDMPNCEIACNNHYDEASGRNGYRNGVCVVANSQDPSRCCGCSDPLPYRACSRCLSGHANCTLACRAVNPDYRRGICMHPHSTESTQCCACQF
jgi:hypothetical protein